MHTIRAVYEAGVLRPLSKLSLREHQPVLIALFPADEDLSGFLMAEMAMQGGSFDFLADPAEDVYRATDGEVI